MTQEAVQEQVIAPVAPVEDQVEIEVIEQEAETPPDPKPKAFDPKTDKVEFSTPEQQEKFNYMYKQTKMSDARGQMTMDLLQKAMAKIELLESRSNQTDSADAERTLVNNIMAARDAGDSAAEINATKEMVEFLADKKISAKVNTPPRQAPEPSTSESPDEKYVVSLMSETDDAGQPVRPYLREGDPNFEAALNTLESIKNKYIGDPYALPKAMSELDQLMRPRMTQTPPNQPRQPQVRAPNPLQGGNLTNHSPTPKLKMTRQELEIAKKLGVDPKRYAAKRDEIAGRK